MSQLCTSMLTKQNSQLQLASRTVLGQSLSLAWLKLAALLQQGTSNLPWQYETSGSYNDICRYRCDMSRACLILERHGVTVQRPPEFYGCQRSRLLTTSFVVALSFEHMAFHVFVQAGYSDPYLLCLRIYRINYTATQKLMNSLYFSILVILSVCNCPTNTSKLKNITKECV